MEPWSLYPKSRACGSIHHAATVAAIALSLFALPEPLAAATGAWSTTPEAKVRLISGWSAAPASETDLDLGLDFELAPGWHVYWKNSGDAGYAPKLDLSATPEVTGSKLLFPAPHRLDLPGGLVSFGYENAVVYPIAGRWHGAPGKALHLRARLEYLVCADECVPYAAELALLLPAADPEANAALDPESSERLARFRRQLPVDSSEVAGAPAVAVHAEAGAPPFSVLVLVAEGGKFSAASPDLFFETHPFFALGKPELSIGASGLRFRVPFRPFDETKSPPATAEIAWTITGLEGQDGPYALTGRGTIPLPARQSSRRTTWVAALSLLITAAALAFWRRRRRSPNPHP